MADDEALLGVVMRRVDGSEVTLRRRRGCGRRAVVLYGVFLLVAVYFVCLRVYDWYLTDVAYDRYSATDIADIERWLDEPLDIPEKYLVVYPPTPPDLLAEKDRLARELDVLNDSLQEFLNSPTDTTSASLSPVQLVEYAETFPIENPFGGADVSGGTLDDELGLVAMQTELRDAWVMETPPAFLSLKEKLRYQLPLSETERTSVAAELRRHEALVNDLERMVSREDYVLNSRGVNPTIPSVWLNSDVSHGMATYSSLQLQIGESTQALRHLHNGCVEYYRSDPGNSDIKPLSSIFSCMNGTSDTVFLAGALRLLADQDSEAFEHLPLSFIPSALMMMPLILNEFYPDVPLPATPRDYMSFRRDLPDNVKRILKRMPTSDVRRSQLEEFANPASHTAWDFGDMGFNEDVILGASKPATWLLNNPMTSWLVSPVVDVEITAFEKSVSALIWYQMVSPHGREGYDKQTAMQDLFLMDTARRVAVLQGLSDPEAEDTLVPNILPRRLIDPFSGKAYLFDGVKEQFYSVGPDGVAGTSDDIISPWTNRTLHIWR